MQVIHADEALLPDGWAADVTVRIESGRIVSVGQGGEGLRVGCLIPAPVNLHLHSFQRAMAGLTERRNPTGRDSFWTWRQLMFRFLDSLTPDEVEAIAAFAQVEALEAGFAAVAEFHYLHHRPDGAPYDDLAEMSGRICAAAETTGCGLTLLPVLYSHGGCDGRPLAPGQVRFGNAPDRFARLWQEAGEAVAALATDARLGVAPHSLRAVSPEGLAAVRALDPTGPIHMHLAEQVAEVEEVEAALGARPVDWLLDHHPADGRWCLIHCTQMTPDETRRLARSGAIAGLCPVTEANLGDGIFDGLRFRAEGGRFGVGSDSAIRISLTEELRQFEYSQRLRDRGRAILAEPGRSTGRVLLEEAARGGGQAAGRPSGAIATGLWADLLALDTSHVDLEGRTGDALLDSWIFAGDSRMVAEVWSAGRHVVTGGRHVARDPVERRYRKVMARLRGLL
ncbi:formimidoylglutamate deiminase [Cereibacter sphaeroides]|uniref:formimidoylglutamate deiminase n=1 Tax=Cereibacter sphaeroides TaxID=1063 RepID=UPI001F2F616F|nr:formimidoylglutamate deiminase [Cereibacter sphaeroides]MCE6952870.1 formimidoylglutamate deiminase [Cereibacter sphaeroides]MCE6962032.1 formimidoylglutamate deiminase [Cereibacter sphaeroides]MCE6975597.1 formimidoylglutamate deiminase [Cereibacter sphaeroides]